jgi:hypothetical protein
MGFFRRMLCLMLGHKSYRIPSPLGDRGWVIERCERCGKYIFQIIILVMLLIPGQSSAQVMIYPMAEDLIVIHPEKYERDQVFDVVILSSENRDQIKSRLLFPLKTVPKEIFDEQSAWGKSVLENKQ